MGPMSLVRHTCESGNELNSVYSASRATGMNEAVSKYRQLSLLQIIRYWVELLYKLQYKAQALGKQEIPFFGDIFSIFYNEDKYFLTRKTYENN